MPASRITLQTTAQREIVDITDDIASVVSEAGVDTGIVCISAPHCTCAIYVNENERGLIQDVMTVVEDISVRQGYLHDRIDNNASAHVAASIIGSSVVLPVLNGELRLGAWQRVMLIELDGPRGRRTVDVTISAG